MWGAREGDGEGEVSDERKPRRDLVWYGSMLSCSCYSCHFLEVWILSFVGILIVFYGVLVKLYCVYGVLEVFEVLVCCVCVCLVREDIPVCTLVFINLLLYLRYFLHHPLK